ncbi:MAG: hypothetical protein N3G75_09080 [Methanothrix sp.]|nr:hypothetical protein [Methanothrix sp.]MCX8207960.1 hypothetical protein [Methanothrix sp.]
MYALTAARICDSGTRLVSSSRGNSIYMTLSSRSGRCGMLSMPFRMHGRLNETAPSSRSV